MAHCCSISPHLSPAVGVPQASHTQLDSVFQLESMPFLLTTTGMSILSGTIDHTVTAFNSCVGIRCGEHCPLWINVSSLPLHLIEALPGLKALLTVVSDTCSRQTLRISLGLSRWSGTESLLFQQKLHPFLRTSVKDTQLKVRGYNYQISHWPLAWSVLVLGALLSLKTVFVLGK